LALDFRKHNISIKEIEQFNQLLFSQISSFKDLKIDVSNPKFKKNYLLVPLSLVELNN
jgi:hypothetical protein